MRAERSVPVGTTYRFVLLLALITVSSSVWFREMVAARDIEAVTKDLSCRLAVGYFSGPATDARREMHLRCLEDQAPALDRLWQLTFWALIATGVVALVIYALLPAWKQRISRLVPIGVPQDGAASDPLLAELAALCRRTGISAGSVRFLLDPYDPRCSATVFGRFGRNTVRISAGLVSLHGAGVVRASSTAGSGTGNPELEAFRGVMLHELNHIANRDVGLTYATVALWRSFLIVVLVPAAVAALGPALMTASAGVSVLSAVEYLAPAAVLAGVVFLARADVLRAREFHADALPPAWHGDLRGLLAGGTEERRSWWQRSFDATGQLFRVHPSAAARRRALGDPSLLFRMNLVPVALSGTVTAMIAVQAIPLEQVGLRFPALWLVVVLALSALFVPLWRAALYAADHGAPSPQGLQEGIALGTGFAVGYLVGLPAYQSGLPTNSWLLLTVFAWAIVAGMWAAQLTSLAARRLPMRLRAPGFWMTQIAGWLSLGVPFLFFLDQGTLGLSGADTLAKFGLMLSDDGWIELPQPAGLLITGSARAAGDPFAVAGAALAWLVPATLLVGSLLRPGIHPRPGLRRVYVTASAGGVCALVVVLAVNRWWSGDLMSPGISQVDQWLYEAGLRAALIATAMAATAFATVLVPHPTVPSAVTTGGITMLLGVLGATALGALDGCLGAFNARADVCTGWPDLRRQMAVAHLDNLSSTLVVGLFCVVVAAVAASTLRVLARRLLRPAQDPASGSSAPSPRAAVPLVVIAAVLTAGLMPALVSSARPSGGAADEPSLPSDVSTRTSAWLDAGGRDIMQSLLDERAVVVGRALYVAELPLITEDTTAGETVAIVLEFGQAMDDAEAACGRLLDAAERAERFIPIPDPEAQSRWKALYTAARRGGEGCSEGLAANQMTLFDAAESLPPARLDGRVITRLEQIGVQ
jgi:Zn-dependent protease with chaperone function